MAGILTGLVLAGGVVPVLAAVVWACIKIAGFIFDVVWKLLGGS